MPRSSRVKPWRAVTGGVGPPSISSTPKMARCPTSQGLRPLPRRASTQVASPLEKSTAWVRQRSGRLPVQTWENSRISFAGSKAFVASSNSER